MSTREYCLIYHRILIFKITRSVWQTVQRSDIKILEEKGLKDQEDWIFSIAYCALNVGEFYLLPFYITHFCKMQLLCSLFSHFPWSICVLRPSTLTCRSWIGTTIFCTSFSASRNLFSKKIWPIFQLRKAAFAGKTLNMLSVFLYSYNSI